MHRVANRLQQLINAFSIRKKLMILYLFCELLPLLVTDGAIFAMVYQSEQESQRYEIEGVADSVASELSYITQNLSDLSAGFYINRTINEFLEDTFDSPLDFYSQTRSYYKNPFYQISFENNGMSVVLYGDNPGIVNGGQFYRTETLRGTTLYEALENSDGDMVFLFYYQEDSSLFVKRKISLLRRLDYYNDLPGEKLIRIDVNYSDLVEQIRLLCGDVPVYLCQDDRILLSSEGYSETKIDFATLTGEEDIVLERSLSLCGSDYRLLLMEPSQIGLLTVLGRHLPLLAALVAINILLPFGLMALINFSFTRRLSVLGGAFDQIKGENFTEITEIDGRDEIAELMRNYNRMVRRLRELIQSVYKGRLERQEADIARQKAELLALRSQINPHFLFNVLESIRMHSILKGETETADMVEQLAILERQSLDWSSEAIPIREEASFAEAYLALQKYRFGDRLSYEITVEEACGDYRLPGLSLMTFVENACVHGIEKKAADCWIYVRVYEKDGSLILETEDTGCGMKEEELDALNREIQNVDIDALRKKEHVGVLNACMRLKLYTQNRVQFEVESEEGVGTFIVIRIPLDALSQCR